MRLAEWIARESPQGLGHWPHTWEIVEPASRRFIDARTSAERRVAGNAVVKAWREARRQWEVAGRP